VVKWLQRHLAARTQPLSRKAPCHGYPWWTAPVLTTLRPAFPPPTSQRVLVPVLAAVLTTGRRPITNLLRTVRPQALGHVSSSHRVCSQRCWSTWRLAHALLTCLLGHVIPPGPVLLTGDDPVTEHPGPPCSARDYTAMACARPIVLPPIAARPWVLPVLVALYRPPEWDHIPGTRQKTLAHLARLTLARLRRRFPQRHFIFVGDSGSGTSERARFGLQHRRHLTWVSECYGDAALYEPPPPRMRRTIGRPGVKGQKPPSPQEVVAHTRRRTRLAVAWYGGTSRDIGIVTGTGP
jgi:hypothetical protein